MKSPRRSTPSGESSRFGSTIVRFDRVDQAITHWMARSGIGLLRVSLGVIFLWFGALKFFPGVSPAEALATDTIALMTGGLLEPEVSIVILALWECFIGIGLLTGGATALASVALGTVLASYGILGLISARMKVLPHSEPWLSPVIGLFTGVLSGATGVFAIPAVPYFSALGLEKEELVQTLGLLFTVCTMALTVGLMTHGRFPSSVAITSLLALIPTLGGMLLGQKVRNRLKPQVFRRWFCLALVVLGTYMVVRALGSAHA